MLTLQNKTDKNKLPVYALLIICCFNWVIYYHLQKFAEKNTKITDCCSIYKSTRIVNISYSRKALFFYLKKLLIAKEENTIALNIASQIITSLDFKEKKIIISEHEQYIKKKSYIKYIIAIIFKISKKKSIGWILNHFDQSTIHGYQKKYINDTYSNTQYISSSKKELRNIYKKIKCNANLLIVLIITFFVLIVLFSMLPDYQKLYRESQFSIYVKKQISGEKKERPVFFRIKIKEKKQPFKLYEDPKYSQIFRQLLEIVESKELFLDPNLTQQDVIKYLGTNRNYLYRSLRLYTNNNFKEFINSFRITRAKQIIKRKETYNEEYKISDIFSQCGFSTNESFYRTFKSLTGTTPGKFARTLYDTDTSN